MSRRLCFLFPELNMQVGGNIAQMNLLKACGELRDVEVITYRARTDGLRYLDDVLRDGGTEDPVFVIHWGPDIGELIQRLQGKSIIYVAHSTGWGMQLPPHVPVICVSRNTLAFWGRYAPNSVLFYVPNIIYGRPNFLNEPRDIEVLVQHRKSSEYLLQNLVPALQEIGLQVTVQKDWHPDLFGLMRRSKVYLYDSVEHWIRMGATEGFGLPPLEALACGCTVFSSVNDALSDFLDPGMNCSKIRSFSKDYDANRIKAAVTSFGEKKTGQAQFEQYREGAVISRLKSIIPEIEEFLEYSRGQKSDIRDPWEGRTRPGR